MLVFATRMLRDKWKSFVIYSISAVVFLEMYVALFPSFHEQAAEVDRLFKSFPPELFKAMNMDPSMLSFSNFQAYLSTEYMSFLWPIMMIAYVISVANYICVNEIDKGTIETLASLPTSRIRIFFERYFAGLMLTIGFCVISVLGAIPLAQLHDVDYLFNNFLTTTVGAFFFAWAVYSLATLFSVLMSDKGKASMLSGGAVTIMYVLFIVSSLKESVENLKYVSFFNYFSGSELLAKNAYPEHMVLALGGFALVAFTAALFWFKHRDLSI